MCKRGDMDIVTVDGSITGGFYFVPYNSVFSKCSPTIIHYSYNQKQEGIFCVCVCVLG